MIELTSDSYILGFWFASNSKGDDWMCCVQKDKGSDTWKGNFRFRERVDEKIYGSDDKKTWHSFKGKDQGEEKMISLIDAMMMVISVEYPDTDRLLVQGDMDVLFEKGQEKPWMNMRKV